MINFFSNLSSCLRIILLPIIFISCTGSDPTEIITNPYEEVDWSTFTHHKAALHVHTLQSDGYQMVDEVVHAYSDAGFSILAITDHDIFPPNARIRWGDLAPEFGTHFPEDPKPENYPANTTWPWSDFEAPSPNSVSLIGIESVELTSKHHMNAFYTNYGVFPDDDISVQEQIQAVKETDGLVIFNHPGLSADWWTRQPVEWYANHFEKFSPDVLIGMEVTNGPPERETYDESLWDQLLARFMPERPIWGIGTPDMHELTDSRQSHTILLLGELNENTVREAMEKGQFYFNKSTRRMDLSEGEGGLDLFPAIEQIEVNQDAGTITVKASNYDKIKWITAPETLETLEDFNISNQPWASGQIIHDGTVFNYRNNPNLNKYVRIELHRHDGEHVHRTFANPIGITTSR